MNIDLYKAISYSFDCLNNPKRMKAILSDFYPDKKLEIKILIMIYISGIAEEIKNNLNNIKAKKTSYIEQIIKTTAMQKEYAIKGIDAWVDMYVQAKADSVKLPETDYGSFAEFKLDYIPISVKKNPNAVAGFEWDYELNKLNDGYEITACLTCEEEIVIPNTINGIRVFRIGNKAFKNNKYVKSVTISDGVTEIGDSAFACCQALTCVVLPKSINIIGKYAFYATKLEKIYFPIDNITVGYGAFGKCPSPIARYLPRNINKDCFSEYHIEDTPPNDTLQEKTQKKNDCEYELDICNSALNEHKICKYLGKANDNIIIPSSLNSKKITCIGKEAFIDTKNIKTVTVSEGIKIIEASAFQRCDELTTVILPSTLEEIENSAFAYTNLNKIISFPNVKEIKARLFIGCSNLDKFVFPNNLETIGRSAFASSGLEEIILPPSVKCILSSAFNDCKKLKMVKLNDGLAEIGQSAFAKCQKLKEIYIPDSVKKIGNNAFSETNALIVCNKNSEALKYACKNLMRFKILDSPEIQNNIEIKEEQNIDETPNVEKITNSNVSYSSLALCIFIFTIILFFVLYILI